MVKQVVIGYEMSYVRDVSKHRIYHAGNHGDLKSEDSNNTTVMRITYDDYPCGILIVGRSSTSFL